MVSVLLKLSINLLNILAFWKLDDNILYLFSILDINEGIDFVDDYNNNCNTDMQNHIEISTLNISGMYETYQKYIKIYKCI